MYACTLHTRVYMLIHALTNTFNHFDHLCSNKYAHICIYMHTFYMSHIHTCMHACMVYVFKCKKIYYYNYYSLCMYVCMYACMHAYIDTYLHIY